MRRGCLIPKQKCFQFMLETREAHVLSYVRWQTVPHMRACHTEASIAESVVCPRFIRPQQQCSGQWHRCMWNNLQFQLAHMLAVHTTTHIQLSDTPRFYVTIELCWKWDCNKICMNNSICHTLCLSGGSPSQNCASKIACKMSSSFPINKMINKTLFSSHECFICTKYQKITFCIRATYNESTLFHNMSVLFHVWKQRIICIHSNVIPDSEKSIL